MTVVVTKGLISRANQGSASQPVAQPNPNDPQNSHQNAGTIARVNSTAATITVSNDAVINSVRNRGIDRTDSRIRTVKEADQLAEKIEALVRGGEDSEGEAAHGGLDPVSSTGHLRQ